MQSSYRLHSIDILEQKVTALFKQLNQNVVIFSDNCDITWPSEDIINVVLFGAGFKDLSMVRLWPRNAKYRLWVLNQSIKNLICEYYKIPDQSIGVIDRYELFPKKNSSQSFRLQFNDLEKFKFLYSGRALTLKNVNHIFSLLSYLGQRFNKKIALDICAPHAKQSDFDRYEYDRNHLAPSFLGDLGYDWYQNFAINDYVLINLSSDPIDDFNVSTAQWQSYGGKLICPSHGPYRQVTGDEVLKIKTNSIVEVVEGKKDISSLFSHFSSESKEQGYSVEDLLPKLEPIEAVKIQVPPAEHLNQLLEVNSIDLSQIAKKLLI